MFCALRFSIIWLLWHTRMHFLSYVSQNRLYGGIRSGNMQYLATSFCCVFFFFCKNCGVVFIVERGFFFALEETQKLMYEIYEKIAKEL